MPMVREKALECCSRAIRTKLCSHTRVRWEPGIRKGKMRERGIRCENPFQRVNCFVSVNA